VSEHRQSFQLGPMTGSITTRRKKPGGRGAGCLGFLIGMAFFGVFLVAGSAVLWMGFFGPLWNLVQAQSWSTVPCTILSSEVANVGKTHRIAISYEYDFNGQKHEGNRYSFMTGGTAGFDGKAKVVAEYPVGEQRQCYVNPDAPSESVLSREFQLEMLWGLLGIPFFLVGFFGLLFNLLGFRKSRRAASLETASYDDETPQERMAAEVIMDGGEFSDESLESDQGPIELKPDSSRIAVFIGLLLFSLVWNGIVFGIIATILPEFIRGKWEWVPAIVLGGFACIGILLLIGLFHQFLGLFNPLPILRLNRSLLPLGSKVQLNWQFQGAAHSVKSLKIQLKGLERVTYRQGTSTSTQEHVFHDETVLETYEPTEIEQGTTEITIPGDSMHTLNSLNNKILWRLDVQGSIRFWPDVTAQFPIRVVPHE